MANAYFLNQPIKLTVAFTVSATDPDTVTAKVKDPTGAETTYTYAGSTVTKDSTGNYHVTITPTIAGRWQYGWEGTGAAAAATESFFISLPATI